MEELQDAIEDVQYMNAMHDGIPRPTQEWKWPSPEEFQIYLDKVKTTAPRSFEPEGLCRGSLGFYTFMKFCKEQDAHMKVMAEFIEEVAAFRAQLSSGTLFETATEICDTFLRLGSTGTRTAISSGPGSGPGSVSVSGSGVTKVRAPNLIRHIVSIDDREKSREGHYPKRNSSVKSPYRSIPVTVELSPLQHIPINSTEVTNAVRAHGYPIDDIIRALHCSIIINEEGERKEGDKEERSKIRVDFFDKLEGYIFNYIVEKHFTVFTGSPLWTKLFKYLFLTERKVVEDDFSLFRVLGRGGFGLVNACKRCTTGKLYAMKMLNKKRVKMKKAEALCLNERNILAVIQSPYVVCLKYAFTTKADVFLILDLMTGGDLGFHLSRKGRFSEKETKYYAARTLLGLAAMHEKNIAYRDLKPENILMDEDGYTKISDLGLACKIGKTGLSGTCGTRGYWAPEMLRRDASDKREKYTVTVDWFSFGCCLYEFMYGISPFRTDKARRWGEFPKIEKVDRDRAIDLAIQQMEPDYDDALFHPIIKDLISKLLIKDGKKRLGANGFHEIAAHPWFAGTDWDNLCRSTPPMKPGKDLNMPTQNEIGCFLDEKLSKKIQLTDDDHSMYDHWEFISRRSFQEEVVEYLIIEEKLGPITIYVPSNGCCSIS